MTLDALESCLRVDDDSADLFVRLDSVDFREGDSVLLLSILESDVGEVRSRWQVTTRELRDFRVMKPYDDLWVHDGDHVLARQHTEDRKTLYFRGTPTSPVETLGNLMVAHRETAGDWIPFAQYINSCLATEDLLAGGFGQLAEGPVFLIDAYSQVLQDQGLAVSTVGPRSSLRWDGKCFLENREPLEVLIIGQSFFVAEGFEEERLSDSAV